MAFYPQFPAFYAYPMPYPSQEFYAMYPPGSNPGSGMEAPAPGSAPIYFDGAVPPPSPPRSFGHGPMAVKHGFANRKDSSDSGISELSSRKTSSSSAVSNLSGSGCGFEESLLDDVAEEEPYETPDDDLCEKIVAQVEFYFGDANITKDKFLLKHVKRNKEGFVSLKLISSFKRVKHLTRDWRQVAEAIERKSSRLEVNDLRTKVRRLEPLPEYDETTPSRTVVALHLPLERPTIEAVAEMFSVFGDIVLVRILRPGNPIPADIKPFANKHPEMTAKVCALVEFEKTEFAMKAVRELTAGDAGGDETNESMIVMELTAPPAKSTKNKEEKTVRKVAAYPTRAIYQPPGFGQQQQQPPPTRRFSHAGFGQQQQHLFQQQHQQVADARRKISLHHNMKFNSIAEDESFCGHQLGRAGGKDFDLNPNAPTFTMQQQQQRRSSRPFMATHLHDGLMMPHLAQAAHAAATHAAAAAAAAAACQQHPMTAPAHPMMRRISSFGSAAQEVAASGLSLPNNVIRLPRGPEKNSKGFQKWCRNRLQQVDNAQHPEPLRRPGSHAVPIVAPSSLSDKKEESKEEEVKQETTATKDVEEDAKLEEEKVIDAVVVERKVDSPQPGSTPEEAGVEEPRRVEEPVAENDSGNEDEGHVSEGEQLEARQEPRMATGFSKDREDERTR